MKNIVFATVLLFITQITSAQKISKDLIVGVWQSEEYKIEIFKKK